MARIPIGHGRLIPRSTGERRRGWRRQRDLRSALRAEGCAIQTVTTMTAEHRVEHIALAGHPLVPSYSDGLGTILHNKVIGNDVYELFDPWRQILAVWRQSPVGPTSTDLVRTKKPTDGPRGPGPAFFV